MQWESWLEKVNTNSDGTDLERSNIDDSLLLDTDKPKKKPTMFPRIRREFEDDADDKEYKNASWETWLDKNNAIETSHKEGEKKEEWNGKFDNSTTRDGVKDDKAQDEEEPLEELTDGKLEEVEKLKAWEVFLHVYKTINQHPTDNRSEKKDEDGDTIVDYATGTQLQTSKETGEKTLTDDRHRDMENENTSNNLNERFGKGGAARIAQNTGAGGRGRQGGQKRGGSSKTPTGQNMTYDGSEYNEDTGKYNVTELGTQRTIARLKEEDRINNTQPTKPSSPKAINPKQPKSKDDYARIDTEPVGIKNAAWEVFLEKQEKSTEEKKLELQIAEATAVHQGKIPKSKIKPESGKQAGKMEYSSITAEKFKSWESWLEKMQGAGDARYGNQHLTGMEQHPVDDDESIDLSAESDKNNEKQGKTEDKEGKDNKPYKALS